MTDDQIARLVKAHANVKAARLLLDVLECSGREPDGPRDGLAD